jgi:hypothetical protein
MLLIPGTSKRAHLRENLKAATIVLPETVLANLNGIAAEASSSDRPRYSAAFLVVVVMPREFTNSTNPTTEKGRDLNDVGRKPPELFASVSSVTVAAGMLEKAGLIAHSRGDVKIIDREKLEEAACECYGLMQRQVKAWQGDVGP